LNALADLEGVAQRFQTRFFLQESLVDLLAALVPAMSTTFCLEVVRHIVTLPPQTDQLVAQAYARAIENMDDIFWQESDLAQLALRDGDNWVLQGSIKGLLSRHDGAARSLLLDEIRDGSLHALANFGDVTDIPPDVAFAFVQKAGNTLREQTAQARQGSFGFGGPDVGKALTIVNMWHPDSADWDPIIEMLEERACLPQQVAGTLQVIASSPELFPQAKVATLVAAVKPLTLARQAQFSFPWFQQNVQGEATAVLDVLQPGTVPDEKLNDLISGAGDQRKSAVRIVIRRRDPKALFFLASLLRDEDPSVKVSAAQGLALWIEQGVASEEASLLLRRYLSEPGTRLARGVASVIARSTEPARFSSVVDLLRNHDSAAVRRYVSEIDSPEATD
jgi:hypothetical protein